MLDESMEKLMQNIGSEGADYAGHGKLAPERANSLETRLVRGGNPVLHILSQEIETADG